MYQAGLATTTASTTTELQPAELARPSNRTGLAMAWDAMSRGLLVFGGFNGSYLGDTWRFGVSDTSTPPIVRCQLGQPCLMDLGDGSSQRLMVKQQCSDPDALLESAPRPLAQSVAQADMPRLLIAEPGVYRVCQCIPSQTCNHATDFAQAVGIFIAEGPFTNQTAKCFIGFSCRINTWMGVSISTNDSLVVRRNCALADTSPYSDAVVLVQSNQSIDSFSLDLGRLATGKPELVELCWCPASRSCTSAEDFDVVALQLYIQCPPGQYESEAVCQQCAANHYCPGGRAMLSCPAGSTALVGSGLLLSESREQL